MDKLAHDKDHIGFFNRKAESGRFDSLDDEGKSRLINQFRDVRFHPDKPVDILDIGCGAGRVIYALRDILPDSSSYVGVDFSPAMIERAKTIHKSDGKIKVEFLEADCHALPFEDKSFDYVIMYAVFNHLFDKHKVLRESHRVLTELGGLLIIHKKSSAETNAHHESMPKEVSGDLIPGKDELYEMMEDAGFDVEVYLDDEDGYRISARLNPL